MQAGVDIVPAFVKTLSRGASVDIHKIDVIQKSADRFSIKSRVKQMESKRFQTEQKRENESSYAYGTQPSVPSDIGGQSNSGSYMKNLMMSNVRMRASSVGYKPKLADSVGPTQNTRLVQISNKAFDSALDDRLNISVMLDKQ